MQECVDSQKRLSCNTTISAQPAQDQLPDIRELLDFQACGKRWQEASASRANQKLASIDLGSAKGSRHLGLQRSCLKDVE